MVRGHTRKAKFVHPEFFNKVPGGDRWHCTLCIDDHRARAQSMTLRQALQHEDSPNHLHIANADNPWEPALNPVDWNPGPSTFTVYDDLRAQERRTWVDMSPDLVTFWRRGIEAAERGEDVERMQEFLERLEAQKGAWTNHVDMWNQGEPDWTWGDGGADPWASHQWQNPPDRWTDVGRWEASGKSDTKHRGSSGLGSEAGEAYSSSRLAGGDGPAFVEEYARLQSLDPRQKEKMRTFLEMPTERKLDKIKEMIRDLHAR